MQDVVIIKPVSGRAKKYNIHSASLKTTRRSMFTFQWSSSVHTIRTIHCNEIALRNISICWSKCIELYCTTLYCNIATYWYIVIALVCTYIHTTYHWRTLPVPCTRHKGNKTADELLLASHSYHTSLQCPSGIERSPKNFVNVIHWFFVHILHIHVGRPIFKWNPRNKPTPILWV